HPHHQRRPRHQPRDVRCDLEAARDDRVGVVQASIPIPRQPDASAFLLHFTGGLRAGRIDENVWRLDPFLEGGKAVGKGPFSKAELEVFVRQSGLSSIGFEHLNWTSGSYHSVWSPINPKMKNHAISPADS